MPTTNLGLPLITGNMTANVPRDMNALAEEIDLKVASKQTLTTHKADKVLHITAAERTNWNGKAPASHTHTIGQVTGLQSELDSKIAKSSINQSGGVAGLDGSGKLSASLFPNDGTMKRASGSYNGDGTNGRLINVGFPVKLVTMRTHQTGYPSNAIRPIIIGGEGATGISSGSTWGVDQNFSLHPSGFIVNNGITNSSGQTYIYEAYA